MDNFERIKDGEALDQIRFTPGFMALERLIKRLRDDYLEELASDNAVSRKEIHGRLTALDRIIVAVDEEIAYVRDLVKQEQETLEVTRGKSLDGGGSGDLAL